MSLLDAIEAAAVTEIEEGGLGWRLRRVRSDLVRQGQTLLLAIALPTDEDICQEQILAQLPEAERVSARARWEASQRARRLTPEVIARSASQADAVVIAAVTHARAPGGTWEPVQVVAEGEAIDRETEPPRIPLHLLAASTRQAIYRAAWDLATDGGGDAERLARFHRGSRDVPRNGADVPDVRPPPA